MAGGWPAHPPRRTPLRAYKRTYGYTARMRYACPDTRTHAVVIGASLAGLCAAQVLSEHYDRVTVFDRDELPEVPAGRAAVPQDQHVHLLMARGAAELEALFPGLLAELVEAGVPKLANRGDLIYFNAAGYPLGTGEWLRREFTAYVPSRPLLEWQLRRRVTAAGNVEIARRAVLEPIFDAGRQRVTGVVVEAVGADPAGHVAADLVVDASGRGTRLPVWLEQWGYGRPRVDTIEVGIGYASHHFRLPDGLMRERVVVSGAAHDQRYGLGMLGYEDGVWVLTTFGVAKAEPPRSFAAMLALAERLLPARFAAALQHAEPIGRIAFHRYPTSKWRRYDKLDRFPAGIVPLGDAALSFNPTFGQGMTMTALQAGLLRQVLRTPGADVGRRLNRAVARAAFQVWLTNTVSDYTFHHATGRQRWWHRPTGLLFGHLLGAAQTDPVLAEWFLRRFSLLDHLHLVPPPTLVARTVRHNLRHWLAERRAAADERRSVTVTA